MGAKNQTSIIDLSNNKKKMGKVIIRCEKVTESNRTFLC